MHYVAIDPSPVHTAIVDQILHHDFDSALQSWTRPIIPAARLVRDLARAHRDLVSMQGWNLDLTVIIERPPQTPRGATIESQQTIAAYWMLLWLIQEETPGAKIVSMAPGSWKTAAKKWGLEYPSTLTDQHQRDAYAMLQVHLATKRGYP